MGLLAYLTEKRCGVETHDPHGSQEIELMKEMKRLRWDFRVHGCSEEITQGNVDSEECVKIRTEIQQIVGEYLNHKV